MSVQQRHEAPEVGAMTRRMVRALVRRAAEGDTEALEQLHEVAELATLAVGVASQLMVEYAGYSYGHLAGVLGTSRQAVQQRARRAGSEDSEGRLWLTRGLSGS